MNMFFNRFLQIYLLFTVICCYVFGQEGDFAWGYSSTDGPETWEGICKTGKRQSPINIQNAESANFGKLNFHNYDRIGPVNITDNGVTFTVSGMHQWGPNYPSISGGGLKYRYQLVQFHIHWSQVGVNGSEHTVNGMHYPAEIHLLHIREGQSMNDSLHQPDGVAVVSIMLNMGFLPTALQPFDLALRSMVIPFMNRKQATIYAYQPQSLLPLNRDAFYRYEGSLTTPGCEEAVIWTIMAEPVSMTNIQLGLLRAIRQHDGEQLKDNTRPAQPLNGRKVFLQKTSIKAQKSSCDTMNPMFRIFGSKWC